MGMQKHLRSMQDNIRNSGWRIQFIPWMEQGKVEVMPTSPFGCLVIMAGLLGFLGGIYLITQNILDVAPGIAVSIGGLGLLFLSRYVTGYFAYRNFVLVDGRCVDWEVIKFKDDEPGSLRKEYYYAVRIMCEYERDGQVVRVTPILPGSTWFKSEEKAKAYLTDRMNDQGECMLWVNPKNSLHTVFHKKPLVPLTV